MPEPYSITAAIVAKEIAVKEAVEKVTIKEIIEAIENLIEDISNGELIDKFTEVTYNRSIDSMQINNETNRNMINAISKNLESESSFKESEVRNEPMRSSEAEQLKAVETQQELLHKSDFNETKNKDTELNKNMSNENKDGLEKIKTADGNDRPSEASRMNEDDSKKKDVGDKVDEKNEINSNKMSEMREEVKKIYDKYKTYKEVYEKASTFINNLKEFVNSSQENKIEFIDQKESKFEVKDEIIKSCNNELANKIEIDKKLMEKFTEQQLEQIRNRETPEGYEWRHEVISGEMRLVSSNIKSFV